MVGTASTLLNIRLLVRQLTGNPSPFQLSDSDIDFYVNTFFTQALPAELKTFSLRVNYEFWTQPNVDTYSYDKTAFTNFENPIYVDGYQIIWTQWEQEFYGYYPKLDTIDNFLSAGNGTTGPYSFSLNSTPVLQNTVNIFADPGSGTNMVMIDDGNGNLINSITGGAGSGTIDYLTGAGTVTFPSAVPSGSNISGTWYSYVAGRPLMCLFFDDQFIFRPVPNRVYRVSVVANQNPTQLIANGDSPTINQWWRYIAFGASLYVFQQRRDIEQYNQFYPLFLKEQNLVIYRTLQQQKDQRTRTIYTDQLNGSYNYLNNWYTNP